jgi:nucleoside phosphorylase
MAPKTVPPSKFAEYTVGWICAQQPEFVAARAMLDVEHGMPESRGDADSNTYFLGSVGRHNVVIACLPAGAPGAEPAATVAANMQRTFRHLRVGLLVGVGSGAPSAADDIRLGDVVVSKPTNGTGGVVQFGLEPSGCDDDDNGGGENDGDDGGGSGSGSRFVPTRYLNAPPRVLLSALSVLETEHALRGSRASDILAKAAQKYPQRKSKFVVPVSGGRRDGDGGGEEKQVADRLYQADYVHVGGGSSGNNASGGSGNGNAVCGQCDVSMLVQREHREVDGPAVHYGVIASGGLEIECGVARDRAKKALGAICFEREAAGLMNNFPCLVIRGICDYADTHKSVLWQGYAAAAAAAFAKELLEYMPLQEVQETATIIEAMKDGESLPRIGLAFFWC